MTNIIPIHSHRIFDQENAESILPIVKRITEQAARSSHEIETQLNFVPKDEPSYKRLTNELDFIIKRWAVKVKQLGCDISGLWVVAFDAKDGWYTWRMGEEGLSYFNSQRSPGPLQHGLAELLS